MSNRKLLCVILVLVWGSELWAGPIRVRLPDTRVVVDETLNLPIYVDSTLTGESVLAYQLQIDYDATLLSVIDVTVTGHLGEAFGVPAMNLDLPGQITVAAAGVSPLEGSGTLLHINFELLNAGEGPISFTDSESNFFNEGTPGLTLVDGSVIVYDLLGTDNLQNVPEHVALIQNYPNPFNPTTTIRYGLASRTDVSIIVYDIMGHEVANLLRTNQPAGWYRLNWAGLSNSGTQMVSGVYIARILTDGHADEISMILLR